MYHGLRRGEEKKPVANPYGEKLVEYRDPSRAFRVVPRRDRGRKKKNNKLDECKVVGRQKERQKREQEKVNRRRKKKKREREKKNTEKEESKKI